MAWYVLLTDNQGNALGQLDNAHDRAFKFPLNRVPTGSFRLRRDHQFANYLRQTVEQTMVQVWDDSSGTKVMRMNGPVVGYTKVADESGGSLQFNHAGIGWRLSRRIIAQSKSTTGYNPQNTDRGTVLWAIVNGLHTATPPAGVPQTLMDTGIRQGVITPSANATMGPWYFKNALEAASEMSAALDGYDWQIVPTTPVQDATGVKFGTLNVAPVLGASRPELAYEFGDGKLNVKDFNEVADASTMMNLGYSLPPNYPDNATQAVQSSADSAAIINRGAVYEDTVATNLVDDALRLKLVQNNVLVRKVPRIVISFEGVRSLDHTISPNYGSDVVEGDIVRFRARETGVVTIDTLMRIYSFDVTLDDEGNPTTVPTLLADQQ